MMALGWDAARGTGDLVVGQTGALLREDGLATSVILSLFLDRRAEADDELPDAPAGVLSPRRGWVGDALAPREGEAPEDRIGSRLWLLSRAKQTDETLRLAEDYAREALDWLVEDGLAAEVAVAAEWVALGAMALAVQVTPAAGDPVAFSFGLRTR